MEDLNKKDYYYYLDLISELKRIANIEEISDTEQFERINLRNQFVMRRNEQGEDVCVPSDFTEELIQIAVKIYNKQFPGKELIYIEQIAACRTYIEQEINRLAELKQIEEDKLPFKEFVLKNRG